MIKVFLGLGTNVDRERSMRGGLEALRTLDPELIVSPMYESKAVGFDGAPFYNCAVQMHTELPLVELIAALKDIENSNGRIRIALPAEAKGLDIDVLTYGELLGDFDGVALPRADITRYAHVLLPLSEIAPEDCLPGTKLSYQALWQGFNKSDQQLDVVDFGFPPSPRQI